MAPFFIVLLLGVGFLALLVLGAVALVRSLTRSQVPGPQRLLGGLLGTAFLALFGIVGALLIASAFHGPLRPPAFAAGLVSMLSFVLVAQLVGGYNAELRRVVVVDLTATALLLGAGLITYLARD